MAAKAKSKAKRGGVVGPMDWPKLRARLGDHRDQAVYARTRRADAPHGLTLRPLPSDGDLDDICRAAASRCKAEGMSEANLRRECDRLDAIEAALARESDPAKACRLMSRKNEALAAVAHAVRVLVPMIGEPAEEDPEAWPERARQRLAGFKDDDGLARLAHLVANVKPAGPLDAVVVLHWCRLHEDAERLGRDLMRWAMGPPEADAAETQARLLGEHDAAQKLEDAAWNEISEAIAKHRKDLADHAALEQRVLASAAAAIAAGRTELEQLVRQGNATGAAPGGSAERTPTIEDVPPDLRVSFREARDGKVGVVPGVDLPPTPGRTLRTWLTNHRDLLGIELLGIDRKRSLAPSQLRPTVRGLLTLHERRPRRMGADQRVESEGRDGVDGDSHFRPLSATRPPLRVHTADEL